MTFVGKLTSQLPDLKHKLLVAHLDRKPEAYVKEKLMAALYMTLGVTVMVFFLFSKAKVPMFFLPVVFLITFFGFFQLMIRHVDAMIRRRAKDIDREVLFAGRFLLVKLNTGQPLISAITEASNSYGVASKYFKEIVRDIDLGTPLEEALEKASYYTPSLRFKRILFQITNALKIGIDVTNFISAILDEIADEQLIEIQRYGKKLNSMTLFYMLMAIVIPSLGLTIFIVVSSLVNINIDKTAFAGILIVLAILQGIFLLLFKAIRPNVNI